MKRILIAEDERIVAMALKGELQSLGYEVIKSVSKGEDLINEAFILRPDVIVTDINLKDRVSGIEAIQKIRHFLKSIFIVITGYNDLNTLEEIRKINPDGFLLKPTNGILIQDLIMSTEKKN